MSLNPKVILGLEYVEILIGSTIVALAFTLFLLPNEIAAGGISGLSTIFYGLFGWKPSYVQWAFNLPLFFLGTLLLGKEFSLKTLVGTTFLPFVVYLTEGIKPATTDPLLGALFGGLGVGLGLGIVFRGKGSTGGTALVGHIIHKFTNLSLGICMVIIDGLIVVTSAFVFSFEQALYALISIYLTGKIIDIVQLGLSYTKMAIIISDKDEEIRHVILNEIDRGVTKITGIGGYTNEKRPVLLCVLEQSELSKLKQLVKNADPSAFVIISNSIEVLGEGFKR
ncbi:YitT family protein [Aneurinibacillus thermoaerophilus]|nr:MULTISPECIES: YitT family protein [Aneurinibacillus]MED0675774.1 YitT family protein [Aneurinibacillus thermoaerophilus]MED0680683.1 YitT family protein [Aneurinibacillus thermoaerophilus]MED0758910.1 YitT family protein [Aneurinibacillus thermoaerophilus]MED0761470.1 YitT family protein [Aneurinibacillus thermoaerophilus]MED0764038.1 YitT family protein [Aneurinibacillus thermoaerophilus]